MSDLPPPAAAAGPPEPEQPPPHQPEEYAEQGGADPGADDGVPATGHPAVDAAVRAVAEVAGASPADQVPAFQAAHRTLGETLESIDEG